jgi:hypothetical protein
MSVVSGVHPALRGLKMRDRAGRRRIPDTRTCSKPPYFGRTIALWGLYSAFISSCSYIWDGRVIDSITRPYYSGDDCGAIVLTKCQLPIAPCRRRRLSTSGVIVHYQSVMSLSPYPLTRISMQLRGGCLRPVGSCQGRTSLDGGLLMKVAEPEPRCFQQRGSQPPPKPQ